VLQKPLTSFFGRRQEMADIGQLLDNPDCRLLTLLGPGGIGKTRLAIELAYRHSDQFEDGVVFVPLQAVPAPELLVTAVADTLGIVSSTQADLRSQLFTYLANKQLLLVLDNFEQLFDGAGLLTELLDAATAVQLLVTSRTALHLQEEWLYPLSGLPYPALDQATPDWREAATFDAVQLFVERVRRVRPGFSAQEEQSHLLRICHLVEGMPLALELAAAWGRSLDCATIAAEIVPEMENIRAAWYWAVQHRQWDALDQAIEPLAMFCHLKTRYREAAHLIDTALAAVPESQAQQPVMVRLLSEMGWMTIRLGEFDRATQVLNQSQAIHQQFDLQPLPGQATDPRLGLSTLASIRGDYEQAEQLAQVARQTAVSQNHLSNLQMAYYQLASVAYAQGRYQQAQSYAQAACDVCRQTGDRWFMAYCLSEMGQAARALADYPAAQRHFEASYALREQFSDLEGMALALNNLGDVALRRQQAAAAHDLFARSVALYQQINDKGGLATAVHGVAKTAVAQADYEAAQQQFRQALTIADEIQYTPLLLAILAAIGHFLWQTGRVEAALSLLRPVVDHPAASQETKTAAQQQLRHIRTAASPSLMLSQPPDVATAVLLAQTELNNPIPPLPENPQFLPPTTTLMDPLTARELEVLCLLAQGLTNHQIAERLTVVIGTVKAHNNSIYSKLGVSNRVQALSRARELSLIR
jgi:ATP/maltotriose-dependent transcriptional regulator MalT